MQLTIDEVIYGFNEDLANWEDILGHFETCYVTAYVPKDALDPFENNYCSPPHGPEKERRHNLWSNYKTAIWRYVEWFEGVEQDKAWTVAGKMLKECRDTNKPCGMQLTRYPKYPNREEFRPAHVVEYL